MTEYLKTVSVYSRWHNFLTLAHREQNSSHFIRWTESPIRWRLIWPHVEFIQHNFRCYRCNVTEKRSVYRADPKAMGQFSSEECSALRYRREAITHEQKKKKKKQLLKGFKTYYYKIGISTAVDSIGSPFGWVMLDCDATTMLQLILRKYIIW